MIDFMLKDARQPALGFDCHWATVPVNALYSHCCLALHLTLDARDGQATFRPDQRLLRKAGDLGVSHYVKLGRNLLIFIIAVLNHDQT
jgi:hypothetical protein